MIKPLVSSNSYETFSQILRVRSEIQPDKIGVSFLTYDKEQTSTLQWSYRKLDRKAQVIAAQLQKTSSPGDRALLLYPPGLDFIAGFFGCLYAGIIAVPAYPPRRNQKLSRLKSIVDDAQVNSVLTTDSAMSLARQQYDSFSALKAITWIATDKLPNETIDWNPSEADSDTLALLQYTSGSTGNPKGVMVSHGNLLHNCKVIQSISNASEESRAVSWLPHYHDMGLINGFLFPIYLGAPTTVLAPADFLQKPIRWLQAMSDLQGTHSSAPNFAYQICADKIRPEQKSSLDLSAWEVACNGSEFVRANTLERFECAFRDCGFKLTALMPGYGLAEATLGVSWKPIVQPAPLCIEVAIDDLGSGQATLIDPSSTQPTQSFTSCGVPSPDMVLKIVDPTTQLECSSGTVGEIWLAGESVAQGYWQQPEMTEKVFKARLESSSHQFLRTGDLGFLWGGELFVTGRIKDVIIIRGDNYYPQDIELVAEQSHLALRASSGAAFSIEIDGQERLILAQEVKRSYLRKVNVMEVAKAIRLAVSTTFDLDVYSVVLLKTYSLPKTSSGKVQRQQCRSDFLSGVLNVVGHEELTGTSAIEAQKAGNRLETWSQLESVHQRPSISVVRQWLIDQLTQRINLSPAQIDVDRPLAEYGLSSLVAVGLSGDLQDWLGCSLPVTLLYDYPSITALSRHLGGAPPPQPALSPVVRAPFSHPLSHPLSHCENEPIAIIGMSCRFPGGVTNVDEFWKLLVDGKDAIAEIPADRWSVGDYYPKTMHYAGLLDQVDKFDAAFFGISPREATGLDPQHRLLLEVAWEAIENSVQAPENLFDSATGVFVGMSTHDYMRLVEQTDEVSPYFGIGNSYSTAAGRLSYALGLTGPCLAIDTACSSSLVTIHEACQSLRRGECNQALAGGVNLILTPENNRVLAKAQMLSPDSRCKTFDAAANGYVRGEGCGMVLLKRLSDAQQDGDLIQAVIRGSAINQDGRSNGLTAPNGLAQQQVIQSALQDANVTATDIDYVEAHGTGTALGDPIELQALQAVMLPERSVEHPLWIGSVKTNIGHLEAAAGIAGTIKAVQILQHVVMPAHLILLLPSPLVDWEGLKVPHEPTTLNVQKDKARTVGVSAFGFGGTNAHIIIEAAPQIVATTTVEPKRERPIHLLSLSAKTTEALEAQCQQYGQWLQQHPELSLADICFSTYTGRNHWGTRLAFTAASTAEMSEKLLAAAKEPDLSSGQRGYQVGRPKIAALFTGQGSQYVEMGKQLYETQPTFRRVLDRCAEILSPYLDLPLLAVLYPSNEALSPINQTSYSQPALFAVEYALYRLWQSWGIEPEIVMGHSVGEFVAACVAGVFSLEDGLKLVAARGKLMQQLPASGSMVSFRAGKEQIEAAISGYPDVSIAAINGPESTVISGPTADVQAVMTQLADVKNKQLEVSHAFHSSLMRPIVSSFEQVAFQVEYSLPQIPLISNVTGQVVTHEVTKAAYWAQHILATVNFAAGMQTLSKEGGREGDWLFLECGPQPFLLSMGRQCLPDRGSWLPSLRVGQPDWQTLLASLGELYVYGANVDWTGFNGGYCRQKVHLPTYPFQRQRYWVDLSPKRTLSRRFSQSIHPLLGERVQQAGRPKEIYFENALRAVDPSYLSDHQILGHVVLPGAAYLEMAIAAGVSLFPLKSVILEHVSIQQPLKLSNDAVTVQMVLSPEDGTTYRFAIESLIATELEGPNPHHWQTHATGTLRPGEKISKKPLPKTFDRGEFEEEIVDWLAIAPDQFYQQAHSQGMEFGDSFRSIVQIRVDSVQGYGQIQLTDTTEDYHFHPVLLDGGFQLAGAVGAQLEVDSSALYIPVAIRRLEWYQPASHRQLWVQAQTVLPAKETKTRTVSSDLTFFDESGGLIAEVEGFTLRQVAPQSLRRLLEPKPDIEEWLYALSWQPQPLQLDIEQTIPKAGTWLIFTSAGTLGIKILAHLQEQGHTCIQVSTGDRYQQISKTHYQVNPLTPGDFETLLQSCAEPHSDRSLAVTGVLHLWSLEQAVDAPLTAESLNQFQAQVCGSVLHLLQTLPIDLPIYLVTQGAQAIHESEVQAYQAPLWGLGRAIALEYSNRQCQRIDLDPAETADAQLIAITAEMADSKEGALGEEDQIAYRKGQRWVARLARQQAAAAIAAQQMGRLIVPQGSAYQLKLTDYGSPDYLQLQPMTRRAPEADEVEIQMHAVGLNFRDVLNSLGVLREYYAQYLGITDPQQLTFGFEGVDHVVPIIINNSTLQVGDEVMTVLVPDAFSSFVTVPATVVVKKPSALTMIEAATIPLVFLTAHYGLCELADLQPGERVLIHAAAGGVGQAAVQVAQQKGAIIYATASPRKWDMLKAQGIEHIFNSRTVEFESQIKALGAEMNVVLNSLNGDYISKSLNLLAPGGRFVEIGKADIWSLEQVQQHRPDVAYFPFDLGEVGQQQPQQLKDMFEDLKQQFDSGEFLPLQHRTYPIERAIEAFRLMQRGQHVGKVVITLPVTDTSQNLSIHEQASYLITGGLGDIGLEVAQWLVEQGARQLVLSGRRPPNPKAQKTIAEMEKVGVQVSVQLGDISEAQTVTQIMTHIAEHLSPLKGVIHAAGVLEDSPLQQMSWSQFEKVWRPKALGAWTLSQATEDQSLDFFVCFSSIAALMGNVGQGNYAAANTFMDVLMQQRRHRGLPGLSIQWGPWAEIGMAARLDSVLQKQMQQSGFQFVAPADGCQTLGELLVAPIGIVAVMPMDWEQFFERSKNRPFLEAFETKAASSAQRSALMLMLQALSPEEQKQLLGTHLKQLLAKVLGQADINNISPQQPLMELGLDSFMVIELKSSLESSLQVSIPPSIFFEDPSFETLLHYLLQEGLPQSFQQAESESAGDEPATVQIADDALALVLEADAQLDESIRIDENIQLRVAEPKQIFLTGATGFLGAFLLKELLMHTGADIHCLVRATDIEAGAQRLQQNLEQYNLWEEPACDDWVDRLHPVIGNISQPYLGLSVEIFEALASQLDVIYHSAAQLNFVYPYAALKSTNVNGTEEVIRLASTGKATPLHYISTLGVFESRNYHGQMVAESDSLNHSDGMALGYSQSKWVAEKLVKEAQAQGLPVGIYRPGLISGHSRSGAWNTDDVTCRFLKGCIQIGSYPALDFGFDLSPVDYVAEAIVSLSLSPKMLGQAFHLQHPNPLDWKHVMTWISELGYPVTPEPYDRWVNKLSHSSKTSREGVLSPLAPFFVTRSSSTQNMTVPELYQQDERAAIDCQATLTALTEVSSITCPPLSRELFRRYFSYFVDRGFL